MAEVIILIYFKIVIEHLYNLKKIGETFQMKGETKGETIGVI